jgi:hypothetical protein
VLHHAQLAAIAHGQSLEGFDDVERHTATLEGFVGATFGSREHEADATVGQVDATRHLAAAFVGPIRQTKPGADSTCAVEDVEVHALVEVLRGLDRMRVLVLRFQPNAHAFSCSGHRLPQK